MSWKFAFIGAGSNVFTRNLVRDIVTFPAFQDATIALMDIDDERLDYAQQAARKIIDAAKVPARIIATKKRAEALDGADGVLATIMSGGRDANFNDVAIPFKYGVDQNIADTRGPGGIFKLLRTWPDMVEIVKDIETYCPGAIFLNYTNPMAMLCRAMQEYSKINVTGLCHSVQGSAAMLARFIGAPVKEITYLCAGINHQAYYIRYEWNGKDAIPLIRKAVTGRPEIANEEQVRNEVFLHLGYYVTESSGHNSEYVPWFRKRPDLIEKYCAHGTGWNPGVSSKKRIEEFSKRKETNAEPVWKTEIKRFLASPVEIRRSEEYAACIFNAVFGDHAMFEFNGNVRNFGIVDNLPHGACVEVPVLASQRGLDPIRVGRMPDELAILVTQNALVEDLVVQGVLTKDKSKILKALYHDPLTSAVLSLREIQDMFEEMWQANRQSLGWFGQ